MAPIIELVGHVLRGDKVGFSIFSRNECMLEFADTSYHIMPIFIMSNIDVLGIGTTFVVLRVYEPDMYLARLVDTHEYTVDISIRWIAFAILAI